MFTNAKSFMSKPLYIACTWDFIDVKGEQHEILAHYTKTAGFELKSSLVSWYALTVTIEGCCG